MSAALAVVIAEVPAPLSSAPEEKVVAPVPPDVTTNVEDSPAAVPVVFWLNVGQENEPEVKFPD
jgi:hypothetical protein